MTISTKSSRNRGGNVHMSELLDYSLRILEGTEQCFPTISRARERGIMGRGVHPKRAAPNDMQNLETLKDAFGACVNKPI